MGRFDLKKGLNLRKIRLLIQLKKIVDKEAECLINHLIERKIKKILEVNNGKQNEISQNQFTEITKQFISTQSSRSLPNMLKSFLR